MVDVEMSVDDEKSASVPPRKARLALKLVAELVGHDGRVWGLDWSPEGDTLASCGADRTVRTWHRAGKSGGRWAPDAVLEESQARAVRAVAWAPAPPASAAAPPRLRSRRRRRLAAASFDASVAVWEEERPPPPRGGSRDVVDDDDDLDADDDEPTLWSQVALLQGHESEVKGVAWSPAPGGAEAGGPSSEGEGEKSGVEDGLARPTTDASPSASLGDGEGCLLATCGRDRSVWFWESVPSPSSSSAAGGGPCEFECVDVKQGHTGDVKAVAWHPSGSVLASASYDGSVRLWVPEGGASEAGAGGGGGPAGAASDEWTCAQVVERAHGGETVWSFAFEPRRKGRPGVRAASCGGDGRVSVWECPLPSGRAAPATPSSADSPTERLSWRPGAVARSAAPPPLGGKVRPAYSVDWSRCGGWIASGGGDDAVRVFAAPPTTKTARGGEGGRALELAAEAKPSTPCEINCVRWRPRSSDGEPPVLAAACDDGVVRLWELVEG